MNGDDWTCYEFQPAPRDLLCQFRRKDTQYVTWQFVGFARDFLPEFNVYGLEWKLTGIAREQLDQMPAAVRAQVMPPTAIPWSSLMCASKPSDFVCCHWPGTLLSQLFGEVVQ